MGFNTTTIKENKTTINIEGVANVRMLPYCNLNNEGRKKLGLPPNKDKNPVTEEYEEKERERIYTETHPKFINDDEGYEKDIEGNVKQFKNDYSTLEFEFYFKLKYIPENIPDKHRKDLKDRIFTMVVKIYDKPLEAKSGNYVFVDKYNNYQYAATKDELEEKYGFDVSSAEKGIGHANPGGVFGKFGMRNNEIVVNETQFNKLVSVMLNIDSKSKDDSDGFTIRDLLPQFREGDYSIFSGEDATKLLSSKDYEGFPVLFYNKTNEKTGAMYQCLYLKHLTINPPRRTGQAIHALIKEDAAKKPKYAVKLDGTYNGVVGTIQMAEPSTIVIEDDTDIEDSNENEIGDDIDDIPY